MIITISGTPGSGKSTVAKIISEKLKYKHYSMGDLRRKMALARKMTLAEYNKLGEKDKSTDVEADKISEKLGKTKNNFVMDSRLGFYFIPNSLKIFLNVDLNEAAKRILARKRKEEKHSTIAETKKSITARVKSDNYRYNKYYGIKNLADQKYYDIVYDTTGKKIDATVTDLMKLIKKFLKQSRFQG